MAEAMWAINEWAAIEAAGGTDEVSVMGSHRAPIVVVADGTQVVATGDPAGTFVIWARLMGRPELMEDERFATGTSRDRHRDEMAALISAWAASIASYEAFEEALEGTGIVAGRVRTIADAVKDPWVEHRQAFVDVDSGSEVVRIPRSPIRMSGHSIGDRRPTKWQGQDNREVLTSIVGMSDAQVDSLATSGVLIEREV
jgi:crotonobetainyl-CoA:carnitine CoA-transferase CaiB-like acyl-CoA transferase